MKKLLQEEDLRGIDLICSIFHCSVIPFVITVTTDKTFLSLKYFQELRKIYWTKVKSQNNEIALWIKNPKNILIQPKAFF